MSTLLKIDPSKIPSFIRRQGRATLGQRLAIDQYWSKYCLSPELALDLTQVYGREAPLIVEIGFGNGNSLTAIAKANPEYNYLGIEVHKPGVAQLLMLLEQQAISNVRVYHHDAIEILEQKIPDNSLAAVYLFFPDPWQKRRHHKRRIVRPSFLELLQKKLVVDGVFHAATDWKHYAYDMLAQLSAASGLANCSASQDFCPRPDYRPLTKFESRGINLGHGVWDLMFRKFEV